GRSARDGLSERAEEEVRWVDRALVPRVERARTALLRRGETDHRLEHGLVAPEQTLRRGRLQIEAIEERTIPFGRRARALEEDRVSLLAQDPRAVRQLAEERRA